MPNSLDRRHTYRTAWTGLMTAALMVGLFVLATAPSTARAFQDEEKKADTPADDTADGGAADGGAADGGAADGGAADGDATDGDETTAPAESAVSESYLKRFLRAVGWVFGIIFTFISVSLIALIFMNLFEIRRDNLLPAGFIEAFEQRLNAKDYQGAYETAKTDESMVARVLTAGLAKLGRSYGEAIEGMQEVGEEENMALEHRLSHLALIGTIAPMVGLMGTVSGMIASFNKIADNPNVQPKPAQLAEGISQALWTTLIGLGIAIPAMISYGILRNRVSRLVLEVGMLSESLMSRFQNIGRGRSDATDKPAAAPQPPPAQPEA